jgi:hypothetical protein
MIMADAMTDPRIRDKLHCADEAAPVYSAGLELLVLLVCEAPRIEEVLLTWETPVARDTSEAVLVAVLLAWKTSFERLALCP